MFKSRSLTIAASLAAITAGAAATAAQSAGAATARPAATATVLKVASVKVVSGSGSKSSKLLVNSANLPVYLLTGDTTRHPECTSATCLSAWPAVTTKSTKPTLAKGIKGKIGIWHHKGINQVTLNGHPLYTYAADSAGSASGQGLKSFGGVWYVLTPSGSAMTKA